ncbi:phage virion morphogenesis protein [Stutzerimonas nitrititolerans]|uniref:phage virion morphogenesis protein n=1 Tax=Stutzerimonas nitrititolerans TaxID=2482751 RepID=UPI0028A2C97A|nr:phage virion morphogenesis protein [Stutzerimonas nitrititolerans]
MATSSPFNLDVRGLLELEAQLALLSLPPQLRRRLMNRVSLRIRTQWRKRVREQRDLNGNAFPPRARKRKKGQKPKMLTGLATGISVVRLTEDAAELGWGKRKTAMIAGVHNAGMTQRRTAEQMRGFKRVHPIWATAEQAKRLRRLGYKIRAGKTKRGSQRWLRPSVEWITENIKYSQAGLLIRKLKQEKTGPTSWEIELPKREFFGVANQREVSELIAYLLPQILNSPR